MSIQMFQTTALIFFYKCSLQIFDIYAIHYGPHYGCMQHLFTIKMTQKL